MKIVCKCEIVFCGLAQFPNNFCSLRKITILNLIFEMNAKVEIIGAELKIWRHFDQCLFPTYCCPANCTLQVGVFGSDSGPEMLRGWPEVQRVLVNRIQLHQTEQVHNSVLIICWICWLYWVQVEYTIVQVFWCPFVGAGLRHWKRTAQNHVPTGFHGLASYVSQIACLAIVSIGQWQSKI